MFNYLGERVGEGGTFTKLTENNKAQPEYRNYDNNPDLLLRVW